MKPALTKRFLNRFRDSDSSDDDLESATATKVEPTEHPDTKGPKGQYHLEQTMPADALLRKADAEKVSYMLGRFDVKSLLSFRYLVSLVFQCVLLTRAYSQVL